MIANLEFDRVSMAHFHKFLLTSTCLIGGAAFATASLAADMYLEGTPVEPTILPAVSGVNGKFALNGGVFDEDVLGAITGALSLPVGHAFGLQLDGMAGVLDGDFVGGGGAHLFWRDPNTALLGVYGSYTHREDVDGYVARVGVEGEYYWNNWTASALVGAEFIESGSENDTNFFVFSDLSYYATDNLELSVGHRYTSERHVAALGVEFQLDQTLFSSGVSLFAEGRLGEDDYQAAWGGIRFYLGEEKSLIRRHREDDPDFLGLEDLFTLDEECVPDPDRLNDQFDGFNTCTNSDVP